MFFLKFILMAARFFRLLILLMESCCFMKCRCLLFKQSIPATTIVFPLFIKLKVEQELSCLLFWKEGVVDQLFYYSLACRESFTNYNRKIRVNYKNTIHLNIIKSIL
jgi:hypothetical protein